MTKISLYWWYVRYAILAMIILHCKPRFAWSMATATGGQEWSEGMTPRGALDNELSYWDWE